MPEIRDDFGSAETYGEDVRTVSAKVTFDRSTADSNISDPRLWWDEPIAIEAEIEVDAMYCGSEHLLLVEDDPILRRHGALFLQALGYQVKVCANGFAALDAAFRERRRIELLFTDVSMPGMDGRVLASRLQKLRPEIKVLFTSGYTKERLFPFPDEFEKIRFLGKPYTAGDLATMLRQVLDS